MLAQSDFLFNFSTQAYWLFHLIDFASIFIQRGKKRFRRRGKMTSITSLCPSSLCRLHPTPQAERQLQGEAQPLGVRKHGGLHWRQGKASSLSRVTSNTISQGESVWRWHPGLQAFRDIGEGRALAHLGGSALSPARNPSQQSLWVLGHQGVIFLFKKPFWRGPHQSCGDHSPAPKLCREL